MSFHKKKEKEEYCDPKFSADDSILLILLNATPENPINKKELAKFAKQTLSNYSADVRFYIWLSLTDIYKEGLQTFDKNIKDRYNTYFEYVKLLKLEDWHKKHITQKTKYNEYGLEDNKLMSDIFVDMNRMSRQFFYFPVLQIDEEEEDIRDIDWSQLSVEKQKDLQHLLMMKARKQHVRRIERILYIFSKLNHGIGYSQGFNELIIPFYYVLSKAIRLCNEDWDTVECLSFFMFNSLWTRPNYSDVYDPETVPFIFDKFSKLIEKHLPNVHKILEKHMITPVLYAMRWFTLLFAQDHELPFLIELWDSMLCHDDLAEFILYVGLGHLKVLEDKLDINSSSKTLTVLQKMDLANGVQTQAIITYSNMFYDIDHSSQ